MKASQQLPHAAVLALVSGFCWGLATLPGVTNAQSPQLSGAKTVADNEKRSSVTYEVADLVRNTASWRLSVTPLVKTSGEGIEALARVILLSIDPESWQGAKKGAGTLQIVNDTKLEIHTTASRHGQISKLLEALRRSMGVAVIVESELYEVDQAFYEKHLQPRPGKSPHYLAGIKEDLLKELRKQGDPVKSNKVKLKNGETGQTFSLRDAFVYPASPQEGKGPQQKVAALFQGGSVQSDVAVSADRRRVQLKLTQQVKEVIGSRKDRTFDPATGIPSTIEIPNLLESTTTLTVAVDDGECILLPMRYQTLGAKSNKRVPLLLIQLLIYIEDEEAYRRK